MTRLYQNTAADFDFGGKIPERHKLFEKLFFWLTLAPATRNNLLKQGFVETEIEFYQFRDYPSRLANSFCSLELSKKFDLRKFPEFSFEVETGLWKLNLTEMRFGLIAPVKRLSGEITGIYTFPLLKNLESVRIAGFMYKSKLSHYPKIENKSKLSGGNK